MGTLFTTMVSVKSNPHTRRNSWLTSVTLKTLRNDRTRSLTVQRPAIGLRCIPDYLKTEEYIYLKAFKIKNSLKQKNLFQFRNESFFLTKVTYVYECIVRFIPWFHQYSLNTNGFCCWVYPQHLAFIERIFFNNTLYWYEHYPRFYVFISFMKADFHFYWWNHNQFCIFYIIMNLWML